MKKKVIKIVLMLIVIVTIVALGVSWHKIFNASIDSPNLIVCKNHKDANFDAICDKCIAILPLSEYGEYKKVEAISADGTKVQVEGNMLSDTIVTLDLVEEENAIDIAKKYVKDISDEDVIVAYDITMLANNSKFQPEFYDDSVKVNISNLNIPNKSNLALLHINDDESFEVIPLNRFNNKEIEFKATKFSTYILISFGSYEIEFSGDGDFEVLDMNGVTLENESLVNGGSNFTFSILPSEEYEITNISLSDSNGTISEEVGNGLGKTITISNIVGDLSLTVETQKIPDIVAQPVSSKVKVGTLATFSVTGNNVQKFEWQYREDEESEWKNAETALGTVTTNGQVSRLDIVTTVENQNGYYIRVLLYSLTDGVKPRISNTVSLVVMQDVLKVDVAIDGIPNAPIIISSRESGVWGNTDVSFKMAINGVIDNEQKLQYRLDDGEWIDYTDEVIVSTEGVTTVYGRAVNADKTDLISEESSIVIKIDKVKPTIENMVQATNAIEFSAQDTDSGLSCWTVTNGMTLPTTVESQLTVSGTLMNTWYPVENTTSALDLRFEGSNLGTLYVYVKDMAGNVSDAKSITIIKDILAPRGTLEVEGNKIGDITYVNNSIIKLTITATDDKTSPENIKMKLCDKDEFNSLTSIDNIVWENFDEEVTKEVTRELTNGDGMYTFYLLLKDEAGNVSLILK